MTKLKTYKEIEDFVEKTLKGRQRDIDDLIYYWLTQSRNSEMFYVNDKGKNVINVEKAQPHLLLVNLYNLILKNAYPYKESQLLIKPEPRSINPKANAKALRDYEEKVDKEIQRKADYDLFVSTANELINQLNLKLTISDLKTDFEGDRTFMKKSFQDIFKKYGIEFHDKAINNIFGKIKMPNEKYFRDTIPLFAKNTAFNFSLSYQFSTTQMLQANGIFSAFFMRAAGRLQKRTNEFSFDPVGVSLSECDNNPFCEEKKVIRILASAVACTY